MPNANFVKTAKFYAQLGLPHCWSSSLQSFAKLDIFDWRKFWAARELAVPFGLGPSANLLFPRHFVETTICNVLPFALNLRCCDQRFGSNQAGLMQKPIRRQRKVHQAYQWRLNRNKSKPRIGFYNQSGWTVHFHMAHCELRNMSPNKSKCCTLDFNKTKITIKYYCGFRLIVLITSDIVTGTDVKPKSSIIIMNASYTLHAKAIIFINLCTFPWLHILFREDFIVSENLLTTRLASIWE